MRRATGAGLAVLALFSCGQGDSSSRATALSEGEPVSTGPRIDWDLPVPGGIDLTLSGNDLAAPEDAQIVAGAPFAPVIPRARGARLTRVQVTDPRISPKDSRGYGVLLTFDREKGFPTDGRVLFEQSRAAPGDQTVIENLASNGRGYEVIEIEGVAVAFIHPDPDMASAVFLHDGIKVNIHGPAIPEGKIPMLVRAVLNAAS